MTHMFGAQLHLGLATHMSPRTIGQSLSFSMNGLDIFSCSTKGAEEGSMVYNPTRAMEL